MDKVKLCSFVDETGQDTKGKFFLVSVVLLEQSMRDQLETVIEEIEIKTGKHKTKWGNTLINVKKDFLREIGKIAGLKQTLFYSVYHDTKKYNYLTSITIAKVVQALTKEDSFVLIVVDGLNKKEMEKMRSDMKNLGIKYRHIRGMRDEQNVYLRLADSLAGFVRDYLEGDKYAQVFFDQFVKRGFLQEV
jgi:hypothetical protein